jgi:hypothetical protein
MSSHLVDTPCIEVSGEALQAMVSGISYAAPDLGKKILTAHGIAAPQPGRWYPQRAWLNAFHEIASTLGPNTLFVIGHTIPAMARFPPRIHSIQRALSAIDEAYHMNHRGGEIGSYAFEPTGPGAGRVVCRNPYPSDFDRGIIQGVAERFRSPENRISVHLDYGAPTRKSGADSCTFLVTW